MNKKIQELAARAEIFYYRKGQLQENTERLTAQIFNEACDVVYRTLDDPDDVAKVLNALSEHLGVQR